MVDLIYYLALLKIPQVGPVTCMRAIDIFTTPKQIFQASKSELIAAQIFTPKSIEAILGFKEQSVAIDLQWQSASSSHHIITIDDARYPKQLKQIYDPPLVLYVKGNPKVLTTLQLAIVGSRNPTTSGLKNAHSFSHTLSSYITIVSGLAMGIDACAHLGALEAMGCTIAVCGTGLDSVYPQKNKHLATSICETGALISEFPIGTRPHARNFPKRNRIITGLSEGVLVVEGNIRSGSMVSARLAIEQNKEVFAIPGSIYNPLASGCHALIKEGAYLVDNPNDITQILGLKISQHTQQSSQNSSIIAKEISQDENILLKYIDYDGISVDELVTLSGLSISEVNNVIMTLELNGIIEKTIHNTYIKI